MVVFPDEVSAAVKKLTPSSFAPPEDQTNFFARGHAQLPGGYGAGSFDLTTRIQKIQQQRIDALHAPVCFSTMRNCFLTSGQ
jgi:hypothetical protein